MFCQIISAIILPRKLVCVSHHSDFAIATLVNTMHRKQHVHIVHNVVATQQAVHCRVVVLQHYFSVFNFAQATPLHSLAGCVYTATSACKQRQLCHVLISTAPLAGSLSTLHYLLKMDVFISCEQHSDLCGDKLFFCLF